MSGEHFSGGPMPHQHQNQLDLELYQGVEANVQYGCTDVALRDPATGKIFLGTRQIEPQLGPWFIGGRNVYDEGITDNAAHQIKQDLKLDIDPARFRHISTYSTTFPVAAPGREDHGRHTLNATMNVDLLPEEVALLNKNVHEENLKDEYQTGKWYDPSEIAKKDSDFPFVVKQFVRDLHAHDLMMNALHEEALQENTQRTLHGSPEQQTKEQAARIKELQAIGFSDDEAKDIETLANKNALYAVHWTKAAADQFKGGDVEALLGELLDPEAKLGDFQIRRSLQSWGIAPPEVYADNGPALKSIIAAAAKTAAYDKLHDGAILAGIEPVEIIGRAGPVEETNELISGPTIPLMKPVHEDDRRAIREAEITLPDGTVRRITHLAIKGSGALGNHYHHSQPEYFSILDGDPAVLTAPHDQPTNVQVRHFPDGGHLTVMPGEAHTFQFTKPGNLISSMDGAFDPNDLHPQKLENPEDQK